MALRCPTCGKFVSANYDCKNCGSSEKIPVVYKNKSSSSRLLSNDYGGPSTNCESREKIPVVYENKSSSSRLLSNDYGGLSTNCGLREQFPVYVNKSSAIRLLFDDNSDSTFNLISRNSPVNAAENSSTIISNIRENITSFNDRLNLLQLQLNEFKNEIETLIPVKDELNNLEKKMKQQFFDQVNIKILEQTKNLEIRFGEFNELRENNESDNKIKLNDLINNYLLLGKRINSIEQILFSKDAFFKNEDFKKFKEDVIEKNLLKFAEYETRFASIEKILDKTISVQFEDKIIDLENSNKSIKKQCDLMKIQIDELKENILTICHNECDALSKKMYNVYNSRYDLLTLCGIVTLLSVTFFRALF